MSTNVVSLKTWWEGVSVSQQEQEHQHQSLEHDDTKKESLNSRLPLLDLRCEADDCSHDDTTQQRLCPFKCAPTPIVHIPWNQLAGRAFELPPRHVPFAVLLPGSFERYLTTTTVTQEDENEFNFGMTKLRHHDNIDNKHSRNEEMEQNLAFLKRCFPTLFDVSILPSREPEQTRQSKSQDRQQQQHVPWNIPQVLLASNVLWEEAQDLDILCNHETSSFDADSTSFLQQPRLWQPHPMIQYHVLPLLQANVQEWLSFPERHSEYCYNHNNTSNNIANQALLLEIWDMGSGAGRDVSFLAESFMSSSSSSSLMEQSQLVVDVLVCGIDHLPASAHRCLPFWKRRHVELNTCSLALDLHQLSQVEQVWKERTTTAATTTTRRMRKIMCCYAVRFYHRPLIEWMLQFLSSNENDHNDDCNSIDDLPFTIPFVLAISQFCKPTPQASWNFDHPKEHHVLKRNELRNLVEENQTRFASSSDLEWIIVRDEIVPDGDHGRTLIEFIAQLQRKAV